MSPQRPQDEVPPLARLFAMAFRQLIDAMVEAGYVVRVVDPGDQRQRAVSLR